MERKNVISSNLKSIGYDEESKVLEIEFKSGGTYQYYSVPPQIFTNLSSAPSKGKFFHSHIKDVFSFKKIG